MSPIVVKWNPNPAAKLQYKEAILAATKEVFDLDIKPEAVKNSPVTPEGLERNLSMGKKGAAAFGTGINRQSIDVEVEDTPDGPKGSLYTQSGYGGYLEVGTSKMRAQPYLWPALMKFKNKIAKRVKEIVNG